MHLTTLPRSAQARREFSRRGGITMEHVFAGALVAVIAASVVLTIWVQTKPKGSSKITLVDRKFKCDACGAEFTVAPAEYSKVPSPAGPVPQTWKCKNCGKENTAFEMIVCPNPKCKKWWLP